MNINATSTAVVPRSVSNDTIWKKYNVPSPRYTSYPTVPYWETIPTPQEWEASVIETYDKNCRDGISLYMHLPYCESLCTYCGCNKRITINHDVEIPYIEALLEEWDTYTRMLGKNVRVKEIHLGGGTPTFFKAENLGLLLDEILKTCTVANHHAFGFEAHPGNTTKEHLEVLYSKGFKRLSLGIQDFDPYIQEVINRKQSYEEVVEVVENARRIGYTSINFDLIYGLPFQTQDSIAGSIQQALTLRPDRIAFYSYAHVPWKAKGQRRYDENDLPSDAEKRQLYEIGKKLFLEAGYEEIGMDHFALKNDELLIAKREKTLHRNFMGYTPNPTNLLIGLGTSSISDSGDILIQNEKTVEDYVAGASQGKVPFFRGHKLNEEDLIIRKHILALMTKYETQWQAQSEEDRILQIGIKNLTTCIDDKLVEVERERIKVLEKGEPFLRNICMALDARLWRKRSDQPQFSQSI